MSSPANDVTALRARAAAVREDLQAEFGVSTVAEARSLLADLEGQVEERAAEVRRLLRLAGGTE